MSPATTCRACSRPHGSGPNGGKGSESPAGLLRINARTTTEVNYLRVLADGQANMRCHRRRARSRARSREIGRSREAGKSASVTLRDRCNAQAPSHSVGATVNTGGQLRPFTRCAPRLDGVTMRRRRSAAPARSAMASVATTKTQARTCGPGSAMAGGGEQSRSYSRCDT